MFLVFGLFVGCVYDGSLVYSDDGPGVGPGFGL